MKNDKNNDKNERAVEADASAGKKQNGKKGGGNGGKGGNQRFPAPSREQSFRNGNGGNNRNGKKSGNGGGKNQGSGKNKTAEENRKDTYVYALDGNLYVNLTNKCSNGCYFCVRNERASYYGNYLWLRHGDPTAEKVVAALVGFGDLSGYKELVFCGFGEPTYKVAEMLAVAEYAHSKGLPTRLNTNGQGNLINKREIVSELKGKIDKVNVSLNASCAEKYQPICRSMFGEAGYTAMLDFARQCKRHGIDCRLSVVDVVGEEEVAACKRVADGIGVPLYVRKYIADS